jgi:hypothetical protein
MIAAHCWIRIYAVASFVSISNLPCICCEKFVAHFTNIISKVEKKEVDGLFKMPFNNILSKYRVIWTFH